MFKLDHRCRFRFLKGEGKSFDPFINSRMPGLISLCHFACQLYFLFTILYQHNCFFSLFKNVIIIGTNNKGINNITNVWKKILSKKWCKMFNLFKYSTYSMWFGSVKKLVYQISSALFWKYVLLVILVFIIRFIIVI